MKPSAYLTSQLLDIIFEHKNKNYGTYELRYTYPKRMEKALGCMLSLVVACTLFFLTDALHKNHSAVAAPHSKVIALTEIKLKDPEPPRVLPPTPPAAPKMASQIKYTRIDVVKDQLIRPEEQPPDLDQIQKNLISIHTVKGSLDGARVDLISNKNNGVTAETKKAAAFIFVEQMPRFPGTSTIQESDIKTLAFISRHIHYPPIAREQGIQGTVVVQFLIAPDGQLKNIRVVGKPPGGGLAEEAIRVVKKMPSWIPGKQNGRNVAVQYILPIKFKLK